MSTESLLGLLLAFALVHASPVLKDVKNVQESSSTMEQSTAVNGTTWKRSFVQDQFEYLLTKLTGAVKEIQDRIFTRVGELLDTKEFNNAIILFKQILIEIHLSNHQVDVTAEDEKKLKERIQMVSGMFPQLLEQSWSNIQNGLKSKVDGKEFEEAVLRLREIQQTIFHK